MAKLDWSTFQAVHHDAHCVSLEVVPTEGAPASNLRQLSDTVKRLIRDQLKPEGAWTLQLQRRDGTQFLQCAFSRREEASALAQTVAAQLCPKSTEWPSHWAVKLNDELFDIVFQRAGPPDGGRNRPPRRHLPPR